MGGFPSDKAVLLVYKGLKKINGISSIAGEEQALCAGASAEWQSEDGGHGCGCGEWLAPILHQMRAKAVELDELLLLVIRAVEAGRPGHRLRLLPLRNTRLAIAFEVAKLLKELQEVI